MQPILKRQWMLDEVRGWEINVPWFPDGITQDEAEAFFAGVALVYGQHATDEQFLLLRYETFKDRTTGWCELGSGFSYTMPMVHNRWIGLHAHHPASWTNWDNWRKYHALKARGVIKENT
jgi:hypothetical protein